MQAHSAAEELVLYLIVEESRMRMDEIVSAVEISCDENDLADDDVSALTTTQILYSVRPEYLKGLTI